MFTPKSEINEFTAPRTPGLFSWTWASLVVPSAISGVLICGKFTADMVSPSLKNLVLRIKVMDDDPLFDDKMGACKIDIEELG